MTARENTAKRFAIFWGVLDCEPQRLINYYKRMPTPRSKIVVYVPLDHAEAVRLAIGAAGGGRLGKYSYCSFSVRGVGRFKPEEGARPHIGTVGKAEEVEEERIEVTCDQTLVGAVVAAIKRVHPYEEVALDVYKLE